MECIIINKTEVTWPSLAPGFYSLILLRCGYWRRHYAHALGAQNNRHASTMMVGTSCLVGVLRREVLEENISQLVLANLCSICTPPPLPSCTHPLPSILFSTEMDPIFSGVSLLLLSLEWQPQKWGTRGSVGWWSGQRWNWWNLH